MGFFVTVLFVIPKLENVRANNKKRPCFLILANEECHTAFWKRYVQYIEHLILLDCLWPLGKSMVVPAALGK